MRFTGPNANSIKVRIKGLETGNGISGAGTIARNMGKYDLWVAAIALYLDMELHTADHDFDNLIHSGIRLIKHNVTP
ncbi:hypothetical protein J2I47_19935 [Fibrella sp. HMF5335]|uniref:PIN domain-containing protein n=1 Tax=Fibrella rubiginis TaxID=2817060 RepID=A0A939GJA6_9BACT|nr:hypothetical protein [Fibrella rubiginis]MBO0938833.1 hypothetical protein [Fibrella rubiginis]